MDETIRSCYTILSEQWLPAETVQTVAVPLQSAVQSAYIIDEMTTIEFSSNRTLQLHFMLSADEDQIRICQFNIVIFNELRGTIVKACKELLSKAVKNCQNYQKRSKTV